MNPGLAGVPANFFALATKRGTGPKNVATISNPERNI